MAERSYGFRCALRMKHLSPLNSHQKRLLQAHTSFLSRFFPWLRHPSSVVFLVLTGFLTPLWILSPLKAHLLIASPSSVHSSASSTQVAVATEIGSSIPSGGPSSTARELPIARTLPYPVPNAWGTVILIPQIHRSPGSEVRDQVNDTAVRVQLQILEALPALREHYGVQAFFVEGDASGAVSDTKLARLTQKIQWRNALTADRDNLRKILADRPLALGFEQRILNGLDDRLTNLNREITLEGAPLNYAAEHSGEIPIFGVENRVTQDRSAELVRSYVYLQDRVKTVQQARGPTSLLPQSFGGDQGMFSALEAFPPRGTFEESLTSLEQAAHDGQREEVAALLRHMSESLGALEQVDASLPPSHAPTRAENPYASMYDPQALDALLQKTEHAIRTLVIETRTQEAAENVARQMHDQHVTMGLLQYGVGHQEGLVQALQRQGLTTIVVVPQEVARHGDPSAYRG